MSMNHLQKKKEKQKNNVNTALPIIFVAAAVVLIGGLTVIPAFEEAQAAKGEAGQHISSEGRANQSPPGATNSGVGVLPCDPTTHWC
jgi:hypothetical protein